jgi:hypothetical protein
MKKSRRISIGTSKRPTKIATSPAVSQKIHLAQI